MHRIFFNRIFDYYNENEDKDEIDFGLKDRWNAGSKLISRFKENNLNQISNKELLNLLKNLPQNLILPLILRDIYNLTYQSIAEYLDVPDGVIASRIYRARKYSFKLFAETKLATKLNAFDEDNNDINIPIENLRQTALLLDDELTQSERSEFKANLNKEPYLKVEFEIQELVKLLLSKAIFKMNAPISLKRKIKKEAEKRFFVKI